MQYGNIKKGGFDRAPVLPGERLTVTFTSSGKFMTFAVKIDVFGGHKNSKTYLHMVKILLQTTTKFNIEIHLI